jgi:hypothetical protein
MSFEFGILTIARQRLYGLVQGVAATIEAPSGLGLVE